MATNVPAHVDRKLDFDGLKGLAHPLRVTILDRLSVHGPSTASGLAEALGESSGATSYHLRQLERHGFVREVEGRGTGRERWWERSPGGISLTPESREESEAARAASDMIMRQWEQNRSVLLNDFLQRGERLGTGLGARQPRLHREPAAQSRADARGAEAASRPRSTRSSTPTGASNDPGSRPVQMHINLFPVVDAEATPDDSGPA